MRNWLAKVSLFFILLKGVEIIDIINSLNLIKEYTSKKDFEKIKDTTLNIEKNILNNYHSHNDFKRLIYYHRIMMYL